MINNLAKLFEPIKGSNNVFLFKKAWNIITTSDSEIYDDEDILGICVTDIIKKCSWLDEEKDFDNIKFFIEAFICFLRDNESILHDRREYNKLVSSILGHLEWGGYREGAGRKSTGRKRRNFYITDNEYDELKKYLDKLRSE